MGGGAAADTGKQKEQAGSKKALAKAAKKEKKAANKAAGGQAGGADGGKAKVANARQAQA